MKPTRLAIATVLAVGMIAFMAGTAAAWSGSTHGGVAEEVAEAGGASDWQQDELGDLAYWADSVGSAGIEYQEEVCTTCEFGVDKEYNPWYQESIEEGTVSDVEDYLQDDLGVDWADIPDTLNMDHFLAINYYESLLGDYWSPAAYAPVGTAHYNTAVFVQNGHDSDWGTTSMDRAGKGVHYVQDVTVPYHASVTMNVERTDGEFDHFNYEGWAAENFYADNWWETGFAEAARDGAEDDWTVEITEQEDLEDLTIEAAEESRALGTYIRFNNWEDNEWATEELHYLQGKYTAAIYEYATEDTWAELEYEGEVVTEEDGWWIL